MVVYPAPARFRVLSNGPGLYTCTLDSLTIWYFQGNLRTNHLYFLTITNKYLFYLNKKNTSTNIIISVKHLTGSQSPFFKHILWYKYNKMVQIRPRVLTINTLKILINVIMVNNLV